MIEKMETEVAMANRHFEVLTLVIEAQPIGIVRLADKTGYPKHRVRYSLRRLEEEHLIEPTSEGAVTTDKAPVFIDEYADRLDELIAELQSLPPFDELEIKG